MSVHFTLEELTRSRIAQEQGIDNTLPTESIRSNLMQTMAGLERIRAALGFPVVVSSGYRSYALNKFIGGSDRSQHLAGQAVDFTCPGFGDPQAVCEKLVTMMRVLGIDQLIYEGAWVHASFTVNPRYQVLTLVAGVYADGLV